MDEERKQNDALLRAIKKTEESINRDIAMREAKAIRAVRRLAVPSMDPDDFAHLTRILRRLAETRGVPWLPL